MRIVYATKNFQSGLALKFLIFNFSGKMLAEFTPIEIGTIGVYYADIPDVSGQYIVGMVEPGGIWKTFKYIIIP